MIRVRDRFERPVVGRTLRKGYSENASGGVDSASGRCARRSLVSTYERTLSSTSPRRKSIFATDGFVVGQLVDDVNLW